MTARDRIATFLSALAAEPPHDDHEVGELRDEIAAAGAQLAGMAKSRSEWQWRAGDAERRVRIQRERADRAETALRRARELHRETCPLATGSVKPPAFACSMCDALDEPKDQT